jgi:hypothetical protein
MVAEQPARHRRVSGRDDRDGIRDGIRDAIRDGIRDAIRDAIRDGIRDAIRDAIRDDRDGGRTGGIRGAGGLSRTEGVPSSGPATSASYPMGEAGRSRS